MYICHCKLDKLEWKCRLRRAILRRGGANQRYAADQETGEILDFLADDEQPVIPRRKVHWNEKFIMVFQDEWLHIANKGLSANEWKVLAWLMSKLKFEAYVLISQKQIATDLKLRPNHVSGYLKRLCDLEIIARDPENGNRGRYRFNSRIAWKGNVKYLPDRRKKEWQEKIDQLGEKRKKKEKESE